MAPVASPAFVRRSGSAWKARYRYDEASTSSSVVISLRPKGRAACATKLRLLHREPLVASFNLQARFKRNRTNMNPADKIPRPLASELIEKPWSGREAWRVFGIIAEFAEATERLSSIRPAVSIFGSARVL